MRLADLKAKRTDRPTLTDAVRLGICADCGAPDATPYPHDWIPYCEDCKSGHPNAGREDE